MTDWRERGACWDTRILDFFPDHRGGQPAKNQARRAKALCASCQVTAECLKFALENRLHSGIWGGLTYKQRQPNKRQAA